MKERPIIFNAEMVRAILDGRKTQTRRVIKELMPELQYQHRDVLRCEGIDLTPEGFMALHKCPYGQPGDRLWVRETWATVGENHVAVWKTYPQCLPKDVNLEEVKWKQRQWMPRWASRITLEIVNVRVERLQDITETDIKAEGFTYWNYPESNIEDFKVCWKKIYGPGAWDKNPWVWVVEFKKI